MNDHMIRAIARRKDSEEASVRAFAVTGKELTEFARKAHGTSPVVTAALGRLMCGALMMGDMLKEDDDLLTLRIEGDGPLRGMTVTADRMGNVKGYPNVSRVSLPAKEDGHLDVGGAIGPGRLTVIRDLGLKDPYVGTIDLRTGEIAEDLTYYFAISEQIPSSVGLGVLVAPDESVMEAGGFIIQLMPFADAATITRLEENIRNAPSVTELLRAGNTPRQMLEKLLDGFDIDVRDSLPVQFKCNCSKKRVEDALVLIGADELDDMIASDKAEEVNCRFCGKSYKFTPDELRALRKEMES